MHISGTYVVAFFVLIKDADPVDGVGTARMGTWPGRACVSSFLDPGSLTRTRFDWQGHVGMYRQRIMPPGSQVSPLPILTNETRGYSLTPPPTPDPTQPAPPTCQRSPSFISAIPVTLRIHMHDRLVIDVLKFSP